jgi:hypothetical protein
MHGCDKIAYNGNGMTDGIVSTAFGGTCRKGGVYRTSAYCALGYGGSA